ncbi:MAG: hypothetical protein RRY07_06240, partial [Bacteroidaceae bacterium]
TDASRRGEGTLAVARTGDFFPKSLVESLITLFFLLSVSKLFPTFAPIMWKFSVMYPLPRDKERF